MKRKYQSLTGDAGLHSGAVAASSEINQDAFHADRPALLKSHPGMFVAYVDGKMVGTSHDDYELVRRLERQHPNREIDVYFISAQDTPVLFMDTPEFQD